MSAGGLYARIRQDHLRQDRIAAAAELAEWAEWAEWFGYDLATNSEAILDRDALTDLIGLLERAAGIGRDSVRRRGFRPDLPTHQEQRVLRQIAHCELLVTQRPDGILYTLSDGSGRVPIAIVRTLIAKRLLIGQQRGLFDGVPQTYRVRTPRNPL
jgi:hypothetical protein